MNSPKNISPLSDSADRIVVLLFSQRGYPCQSIMSIHDSNWTRPCRPFTLHNCLLCLLIVSVLVSIQPGSRGVLASENEDPLTKDKWSKAINWTDTKVRPKSNAMTCLSSVDDRRENNCIEVIQASFSQIYDKTLNHSLEYRLIYSYSDLKTNFAVSVESSDAGVEHPILFVVRQQKAITSWELPYVIESSPGYQLGYNSFRRTLCPESTTWMGSINQIVVDISTSSRSNVTFSLKMSVDAQLHVRLEEERRMWVTPSQNRIFKFTFPTSASQVAVSSKSPDDICLTVSVQSPQCPVFDTIYNVEYEGYRQTMTGQSTIIVQKNQYPEGFYLVYIVNTNDDKCVNSRMPAPFRANRTKEVTFTIQETVSVQEFHQVIFMGTLGVYAGFITLVIATCLLVEWRRKRSKQARREWEVTVKTYKSELQPISEEQESQISSATIKTEDSTCHGATSAEDADVVFSDTRPTRQQNKLSKRWRRVSEMTKHQPDFYNKKSKRYVSELCIIAVFYLIPVGQLVWNYKDMMVTTGDQDMCYYNFACAYPYHLLIDFSDFNHFFSNIGYVVLGTIFLLITKRRDYIDTMRQNATGAEQQQQEQERGIPPHYGLSYSMGFGLIVEGILSACYHLCPTRLNYQFDTSFMYVLAVLCTLKLYHARHADINVKSHMAYIVLALLVFLGAGTAFTSQFYFKLGFTVVHLIACVALAIDVYYMGHWKLDKETMVEHVNTCWKSRPLYLERLTLVVVGKSRATTTIGDKVKGSDCCCAPVVAVDLKLNHFRIYYINSFDIGIVCNVAFAVQQLVMDSVDFNTHLLAVFMINLFVYSVFYVTMKMRKREWAFVTNRIYPFLFLLAALAFWLTGSYFFLKKAAKWEKSPAESRMLNQECLVASVYDTHDLWHFLSSTGLFFFFMFLLTLDDDIESKSRQDIPVF
ncbi:SID1 transmembrane family member 1-like isoform X6 [Daphnia pulex]|uniref:SID1 transmembrane family member 1-like isoform X6 n=1 Tax=Daphnia pulex TaxID=6669 RepID=UPI001EDD5B37|nr:SID1 transmembrane family member 1-like isoform X6 [Daphnia pulex]